MADPFNLRRFVEAQNQVIDKVRAELRAGDKRSHWMWYIFPQIAGLGLSGMSQRYAISGREEAIAYLDHPVLGPRLIECTEIVNAVRNHSAEQIFGGIDAQKFRSSMTLFSAAARENQVFAEALRKYYDTEPDEATLIKLTP